MNYKLILVLLLAITISIGTPMVSAKSSFLTAFDQQYGTGNTRLDSCAVCHTSPNGGSLNPYGSAYSGSGGNFVSIENLDSDGDGFSNLDEINALTFPGDPNNHPQITTDVPVETTVNVTDTSADQIIDNQSTEQPVVNETQEKPVTEVPVEEPVSTTTTEKQSPGFEAIIAVAGILAVVCLRRKG